MSADLAALRRTVEADPRDLRALEALSRALVEQGRRTEAYRLLTERGAVGRGDPFVHELGASLARGQRERLEALSLQDATCAALPWPRWARVGDSGPFSILDFRWDWLSTRHRLLDERPILALRLAGGDLDNRKLSRLSAFPALRQLSLDSSRRLSYHGLASLALLSDLTTVEVSTRAGPFPADGFAALARVPALRELVLSRFDLSGPGLASLAVLPGLERLAVDQCRGLRDGDLEALAQHPKLRSLRISECQAPGLSAAAFFPLAELEGLEDLELDMAGSLTGDELMLLARRGKLRRLNIRRPVNMLWLEHASGLHDGLEELGLNKISPEHIAGLSAFTKLERLNLHAPIKGGLRELARLGGLRELVLPLANEASLSLKDLAGLAPRLETLRVRCIPGRHGRLPRLPALRALHVHSSEALTHADLKSIAAQPALTDLILRRRGPERGLSGFSALAAMPRLEGLDLYAWTGLDDRQIKVLARSKSLRSLDLGNIPSLGLDSLKALANTPELRALSLIRCGQLKTEDCLPILARFPKLETLDRRGTQIDYAKAAERLPKIRTLL